MEANKRKLLKNGKRKRTIALLFSNFRSPASTGTRLQLAGPHSGVCSHTLSSSCQSLPTLRTGLRNSSKWRRARRAFVRTGNAARRLTKAYAASARQSGAARGSRGARARALLAGQTRDWSAGIVSAHEPMSPKTPPGRAALLNASRGRPAATWSCSSSRPSCGPPPSSRMIITQWTSLTRGEQRALLSWVSLKVSE